jgi:hypothetical protein
MQSSKTNASDFVMATEAPNLSISDLADVLAALTEVTKLYQLGIQLKIDSSELDAIEKNHPRDIDRLQKTEVVKYWLRNSPDASWTTLANAVEGMRGHARLTWTLREKEQSTMGNSIERTLSRRISTSSESLASTLLSLDECVPRNILLVGRMGHSTSTLGNRMLDRDGWFKINDQRCPQIAHSSAMISSASQLKDYKVEVYDYSGLFEGASPIVKRSSAVPDIYI